MPRKDRRLPRVLWASPVIAGLSCGAQPCPRTYTTVNTFAPDAGLFPDGGAMACNDLCGSGIFASLTGCGFQEVDGGAGYFCNWSSTCGCGGHMCTGRRPPGLQHAEQRAPGLAVGDYFAAGARLEAASIDAFELLALELSAHGAPSELTRRTRAAARDEVRHAWLMGSLARRHGAQPHQARVTPLTQPRPLIEVGLENASEGCVRELYGSHVGLHQAEHSADPMTGAVLSAVAADEVGHGDLSLDVNSWVSSRLPPSGRRALRRRCAFAVEQLRHQAHRDPDETLLAVGLPSARTAVGLVDQLWRQHWA